MSDSLSLRDIKVLAFFARVGRAKAYDIVREFGIGVGSAYSSLNRLVVLGYLVKHNSEYEITDNGLKFLKQLEKMIVLPASKPSFEVA